MVVFFFFFFMLGGGGGGGPNFFTFIATSGYNWTSHGPGDSWMQMQYVGFKTPQNTLSSALNVFPCIH